MSHCFACCGAFRPRYKKLVDDIFPPYSEDGLVKSNMEKLAWYAMHSPDKLDRIGEYLSQRLDRDIYRRRTGYVIVSMDAIDQLLISCHANNLNLFVESFLRMIQKLLESQDPRLQLRATQSFEKYANIKEDTPQYHRRYDFFVEKFAAMCYSGEKDDNVKLQLRNAGIMGLQGVIRKTDWDNLSDNIWQQVHMDKIVPALLFNMERKKDYEQIQMKNGDSTDRGQESEQPFESAETCLRELISRATSGKIYNIIKPLLHHLDHLNLWIENTFAVQTFTILMNQAQHRVTVIKMLIAHLASKATASVKVRIGIADVLSKVISVAARECIGPSVIDVINSLLHEISSSIVDEKRSQTPEEAMNENLYQDTLIQSLGEYCNHLPDYQKIEAIGFIMEKVPMGDRNDREKTHPARVAKLQHLLLKSLLMVRMKYTTVHFTNLFSPSFLLRLMRMSVSKDNEVRLIVQKILHSLIDRHENAVRFSKPKLDYGKLILHVAKTSRQDINFWKKNSSEILLSIQENCEFENNNVENIQAIFTTFMLLLTEIRHDDVVVDILRVLLFVQNLACENETHLSAVKRIHLHALAAAVMAAVAQFIPPLKDHVRTIIEKRTKGAVHLVPELLSHYGNPVPPVDNLAADFLFDSDVIVKSLKEAKIDDRRLTTASYVRQRRSSTFRHQVGSGTDLSSMIVEVDSAASSPGLPRHTVLGEDVTFESLKKTLQDSPEHEKKEDERKKQFRKDLLNESYDVLLAKVQQPDMLQNKLTDIFNKISSGAIAPSVHSQPSTTHVHVLEMRESTSFYPNDSYIL